MKLKKKSAIVLFLLFFTLSISYSQEKAVNESSEKNIQENIPVKIPDPVTDKIHGSEKKSDIRTEGSESAKKKKTVSSGSKSENQKNSLSVKDIPDNFNREKAEEDILLINEGNFKYKRIPDVKLIEKKVEQTDVATGSGTPANTGNQAESSKTNGFFGLGKTASDIIVKGGVLLLILLIFILYKSRMSVPRGKSSKSRKVLNSFRK